MSADMEKLQEMLAGHPDPTVRMLAEMWSRRQEEAETAEAAEEEEPRPLVDPLDVDALGLPGQPDARALGRRVEHLELELERLQEINDTLAAALGACEVCWGDDPDCEACRGRGGPGSLPPDRDLFQRLVMPAVRRLRESRPLAQVLPIDDRATTERREG